MRGHIYSCATQAQNCFQTGLYQRNTMEVGPGDKGTVESGPPKLWGRDDQLATMIRTAPVMCVQMENPRDRGAWWAAVSGVTQSWTRLK